MDTTTTIAPTKAEVRMAEQAAKRAAKETAKALVKAKNAERRANGVIGTLHQALSNPYGTTKREILATLTDKFPERDPIGMATTVGIQLSRLQKKYGKIVSRKQGERGLVYGYEATVKYTPEGSDGTTTPTPVGVGEPILAPGAVDWSEEPTGPTLPPVEDPFTEIELLKGDGEIQPEPTPEQHTKPRKGGKKHR